MPRNVAMNICLALQGYPCDMEAGLSFNGLQNIMEIKKIMSEVFECDIQDIDDDAEINKISGWDSLNHIKLVLTLNQNGVDVPHALIADLTSYAAIKRFVETGEL